MVDLQDWCSDNRLKYNKINDYLVEISDEKYVYVIGDNEDKLFNEKLHILFKAEEVVEIINNDINLVVFEFGEAFYYSKFDYTKFYKKFEDEGLIEVEVQFNDLKHLGKAILNNTRKFAHLGIHSEYELLNGASVSKQWIAKAKFTQTHVVGICDKNTLAGTLAFQIAAADKGVRCVLGTTVDIRYNFSDDRMSETHEGKIYVKNEIGWRNALRINKVINVDNFKKDAVIDEEQLLQYGEGLIFVFSTNSIVNSLQEVGDIADIIDKYREAFDDVYYQFDSVEFHSGDYDVDLLNKYKQMRDIFFEYIPFVLINDSYYIDQSDHNVKRYLNLSLGKNFPESDDQYFKTLDDVEEKLRPLFEDENEYNIFFDTIVNNANKIADECNYQVSTGFSKLPRYEAVTIEECEHDDKLYKRKRAEFAKKYGVNDVDDNDEIFFRLIEIGMADKLKNVKNINIYLDRIEKEASVLVRGGFVDYFLMLWDCVRWCSEVDIMVGVGRGSVGGCLIAYLLYIINIDPIQYNLLFERFMNETRAMPEECYIVESEDGNSYKFALGEKILLKNGKYKVVEELKDGDEVDAEFVKKWLFIK